MIYKRMRLVAMLIVMCMLVTILPMGTPEKYKASEKAGAELLELLDITYEDLVSGNFVDDGETYSCIIWIQEVEIEEAVKAGIDAAEKTKENYSLKKTYEYPYEIHEVEGLKYVDVFFDENVSDKYVQTYIEAEREAARELYKKSNNNFVLKNFMARDMSITYVSQYSPCVFAELTISKIAELIKKDEVTLIEHIGNGEVADVYDVADEEMTWMLPTSEIENCIEIIRGDEAKNYFAVTGDGIKVGQIETYTPDSTSVTKESGYANTTNTHADNVYNIMRELAPDAIYYASGIGLGGQPRDAFPRIEWLLSQGVNVINMSAVFDSFLNGYFALDKWLDHIAYNHDVHFVAGAGNSGSYGVGSPAMGYNIITVGATENEYPYDRIENMAYNEVVQEYYLAGSSYNMLGASLSEHRTIKPDMTAPGRYASCWGTSFAAPLVTATIALMCEYYPTLKTKQHEVKAILAASTAQNVTQAHYVTGTLDFKKSGAGLIDAHSAL